LTHPRRIDKDPRLGAFGLAVAAGGYLVGLFASVTAFGIVAAIEGVGLDQQTFGVLVASSVGLWVGILGLPLLVARGRGGAAEYLGLRIRPLVDAPLGVAVGLVSTLVSAVVGSALLDKVESKELDTKATEVIDRAQHPAAVALLVIVLCVLTPLAEEVFFRGLVFRSLGRIVPVPVAVIGGGAVFGVVHFSGGSATVVLTQLGLLAAFGAVLCVLTWRTGRLGAAMLAHATFNLVAVLNVVLLRS
jgi:membrane protease YdiL (CAAX protease family)